MTTLKKWHFVTICNVKWWVYILYNRVNLLSPQNNSTQPLMSKPLATKVSTPPKWKCPNWVQSVNILCGHYYFQHCLNPLDHELTRASQVATGVLFHSSMMTSQSWWMLETLRSSTFYLMMPHRCSIGFRSGDKLGQSITFTLSFFRKAVVVLEVCLESLSCWNTALRPSLRREGIMLCFRHVGIHGSLNEL